MRIRLIRDDDYAAIASLHRQTIRNVNSKDYPEDLIRVWSNRSTAKRFHSNSGECKRWVAVQDDKIIGFCDHGYNGEFWGLYVHNDYIGKEVGSNLLKVIEKSILKCGFNEINLKATVTAKNFYKKHGYKVVKKSLHRINDKKMLIFMMTKEFS